MTKTLPHGNIQSGLYKVISHGWIIILKTCVQYQRTLYIATSGFYVIIIIVANWPCHAHGGIKNLGI